MTLTGKLALVTGASRGIGRAIAMRLAQDGARVAVNYRSETAQAEAVVHDIIAAGGDAFPVQADVADPSQIAALRLPPVDILVNNAGVFRRGDLADFDFSQMDPMRRINVDGVIHCTRAVVEAMKKQHWGRIVNITSIAGHGTTMAGTTFYAITKAAIATLTKRFALELGPSGITVNAVAPGFILTDMTTLQEPSHIAAKAMVGRVGKPEDIAHAVAFLVSPQSSFITAQVLTVDGGRTDYIGHP